MIRRYYNESQVALYIARGYNLERTFLKTFCFTRSQQLALIDCIVVSSCYYANHIWATKCSTLPGAYHILVLGPYVSFKDVFTCCVFVVVFFFKLV